MNNKQAYKSEGPKPEFLHEIKANGYNLKRGMQVSVNRRPNLPAGKWVFLYAERADDVLFIHVEGPVTRRCRAHTDCSGHPRHKVIREADIKQVHVKTG